MQFICNRFQLNINDIPEPSNRIIFTIFLLISYFYSAKPLRFKDKTFFGFSSYYLYVMPVIFAYYLHLVNSINHNFHRAYLHVSAITSFQSYQT